eukprot:14412598-Alexandrium_andersonii.AAC.1
MALGQAAAVAEKFRHASSEGLSVVLGRMAQSSRAEALRVADHAAAVFCEAWLTKTSCFQHWPFKVLWLCAPYFGGDVATGKATARDLLA